MRPLVQYEKHLDDFCIGPQNQAMYFFAFILIHCCPVKIY